MQLRLKTKFTLTTALLVLAVVGVISSIYVTTVTHQVVRQSDDRARFIAQQVFLQAIRGEMDLAAHWQSAIDSLRIVLAADQSYREGRTVTL